MLRKGWLFAMLMQLHRLHCVSQCLTVDSMSVCGKTGRLGHPRMCQMHVTVETGSRTKAS